MRARPLRKLPFALATLAAFGLGCTLVSGGSDYGVGPDVPDALAAPDADASLSFDAPATDSAMLDAAPLRVPESCKELRARGIDTDGVQTIDPDGPGPLPIVSVFCEMSTDGGGWTLVARSVASGAGPFGWRVGIGLVTDDATIYSLGGPALAIPFTEVLVAAREGEAKALGASAYKLAVGAAELVTHDTTAISGYAITTVRGTCAPDGGPEMLLNTGFIGAKSEYTFRNGPYGGYGLRADGFALVWGNCLQGGDLNHQQGMIFVR